MAFASSLLDLNPSYEGPWKTERWSATSSGDENGPATIIPRFMRRIDDFTIEGFGGTFPSSYSGVPGSQLVLTLPASGGATLFRIKLYSRYD